MALVLAVGGAAAQPAMSAAQVQTADEALEQDAGEYARRFAVPVEEAARRLRAQADTVAITDQLALAYRDRLAGIAIEHVPEFRIAVLLTGWMAVPDQVVSAGGLRVPIVFRTGAAATRAQLVTAIVRHQAELRAALPYPPGMGVDPRTGELVLLVAGSDADLFGAETLRAQVAQRTGVPVRIRSLDRPSLDMAVEGGARVVGTSAVDGRRYACTTGFIVTDGSRGGVVTAAHCPDTLTYVDAERNEQPLDFVAQWGWGNRDVQVHVGREPMSPMFFADTAKTRLRAVTGSRSLPGTRGGEFVCHRGERTGYSCAPVELLDFAPAGDLCGGACTPTWVAVSGPTCKAGDSGGPVFAVTLAIGIVKGGSYRGDGSCGFYFYMSTDFLPAGWSLARVGAAVPGGPPAIAAR